MSKIIHSEFSEWNEASFVQKRLYALNQKNPEGLDYNITLAAKIEGKLDYGRFEYALKGSIDIHPMLNAKFDEINGNLMYSISKNVCYNIEFMTASEYENKDFEDFKKKEIEIFIKPYDLKNDPLYRIKAIQYSDDIFLVLIDFHHIIFDRGSSDVFFNSVSNLYNNKPLDVSTYNYNDYAVWQRELVASNEYIQEKQYWAEVFSTPSALCNMLVDHPEKRKSVNKSGYVKSSVYNKQEVEMFCKIFGCTKFSFWVSILSIVLSKLTYQNDITIGTAVSGRRIKGKRIDELQSIVGMIVNTLPARNYVDNNLSISEFIKQVHINNYNLLQNSDVQYEEIVELSKSGRQINPLFDVMVRYQKTSKNLLDLDNVKCLGEELVPVDCVFDISVLIDECDSSFDITVCYSDEMYEKETIERIIDLLLKISEVTINNSDLYIGQIPLTNSYEQERILKEFNNTAAKYPKDKTVVDLLEEQVEKTPENIAVVFEDERLTYKELNRKANQLAGKLRGLGIKPDDFVAIMAERSIEMIVGIYGIIKAGGAYVPIDPEYPADRIKYMLNDCNPKAVLVYKAEIDTEIPKLDLQDKELYTGESANLMKVNKAEDLIYCIYTSGTTGTPKGVMIEHCGIVNLREYFTGYFNISEKERILLFANIIFDGSVWEMLMAFFRGATLYIPKDTTIQDVNLLCAYISKNKISTSYFPPVYYEQCLVALSNYIITAGSMSNYNIVEHAIKKSKYVNSYGPTEGTICATHWECQKGEKVPYNIPIGKPISNKQIYILNGNSLCGIGVPGELCIAGTGLARGYLNKPELTEEKFVNNPYGEGRLYRTGDLARWLPDGNIEYLGRIDEQVKIRGFRIELGEIESIIRKIDKVKDAAIIAREDDNGDMAINAYIVSDEEISITGIRDTLGKSLPEYMIPAYIMQIEKIPVTRNGKLDKRALPKIEAKSQREYIAPRNETEGKLARVFEEILAVERVGVKDSFFELGGHSLKATRAINRIEAETGVCLPPKAIFTNPTVEGLSKLVKTEAGEGYEPIPKAGLKEYYPMSSTQKRIYLINQMDEHGTAYNMPQSLRLRGEVKAEAIRDAVQELINRHEILQTDFLIKEGEPVQNIRECVKADFEYVEDKQTPESELVDEFVKPFDLGRAPLVRVKLVKREDYHLLLIDMHHIVSDAMSTAIFIKEFSLLYNGEELDELTHQYKDYSEWMRTRGMSAKKEYWINEFSDEIPVLDMPLDYKRPQEQSFKGAMTFSTTGRELGDKVKKLAGRTGTTEYMIFLSAAMITLSKYSRQEDIVIGSPISGRTHKDTESILGMFVNTLAMRGRPEGKKSYAEFLREVRESCLKAYENQEYPFEELVEAVEVRRDISRNPLFDVMLVLQNNEEAEYTLNKLEIEHTELEGTVAKFDLTFKISESEGGVEIGLEYSTDLFKKESAERILAHYIKILEQIAQNPAVKISDIEVVTEEERELIVHTFNDTATEYPKYKTVVDLFEEQVGKTPDNIAVVFENGRLTYKELNRKANQLAGKLRELGVKPDDFVAIMTERSIEMIVGIYGIIKAGGAYVPIDPAYPADRIKYMLEDCAPKALVVFKAEIEIETGIPVIDLQDKEVYTGESANLKKVNKQNDLVYCIYTSGTTGNPKGVMIEHKGVVNLCSGLINKIFDEYMVKNVALISPYVFDASIKNIFASIVSGRSLHIMSEAARFDSNKIVHYINENNIDAIDGTPTHLKMIKNKSIHKLKVALIGGEKLEAEIADWFNRYAECDIYNVYGPTETTVDITSHKCDGTSIFNIPIGKPISNTRIYIQNNNQLCGIGMPGELCIAGDGVARGYLNQPELTSEKFVDNPYGEGKLYRSGDLVRWLPDGNIEYLGRIDEQVKIRGYRIELGEIESVIRKIDKVRDAVVIAREDGNGDKSINAYIVSDEETSVTGIRDRLEKSLPEYMIPSYIMQIEKIPVTGNGKIDKRALPKIEAKSEKEYVAPRNETEEIICRIFSKVLNVPQVGINDNFFELGGHSLLAIKFEVEMSKYNLLFKVKDLFKYKTVCNIADYITYGDDGNKTPEIEVKNSFIKVNENKDTEKTIKTENGIQLGNIEPFNDLFYKSCLYNALFPAFKHYNKNVLSFLINDVLTYVYDEEMLTLDIKYLDCTPIENVYAKEGIEMRQKSICDDVIGAIIESVRKERPVAVPIDCYYSPLRKDTYKTLHWLHIMLVYGFDLKSQKFYIIEHDHKDNLTYDKKLMSFEDLKNAYIGSINNFGLTESTYYELVSVKESESSQIPIQELNQLQKETLIKNISCKKDDLFKGLEKLEQFIETYSSIIANENILKEKVSIYVETINNVINAKEVEKYRMEHVFGDRTPYYKKICEITELWNKVRIYLGKYMYFGMYDAKTFERSLVHLKTIMQKEKEYIEFFV